MADPFEVLDKSQRAAMKLATDSLRTMRDTAVLGVTAPDVLVSQVTELAGAVTGLAGVTAQPLQDFIVRQRELAESVAALAEAQATLAGMVADMAEKHAATVTALEKVTAPLFVLAGTTPTAPSSRKSRSKPSSATPSSATSSTARPSTGKPGATKPATD